MQIAQARGTGLTPQVVADVAWLCMEVEGGAPLWPAAHHWLWLHLLCDTSIRRLLIIAPPESAKTTWVVAYLAASIGFYPEEPRIFASASGDVAKKRSMALRQVIESAAYQEVFPGTLPARGMSYEQHQWSVAQDGQPRAGRIHPTVSAYGTGGSITGSRAFEAIGDDILDHENTRTAYQREFVDTWAHNSLFSRVRSRVGRTILIGTAWHHDDLYARIRRSGQWVVCHIPLLSAGEDVYATLTYPPGFRGRRLGQQVAEAFEEQEEADVHPSPPLT